MKLGFAYRFTTDETGQLVGEVIGQRGNIPVSYWVRADRRSTPDELVPALDAMLEKTRTSARCSVTKRPVLAADLRRTTWTD